MKKMTIIAMALTMVLTTTACGASKAPDSTPAEITPVTQSETVTEMTPSTADTTDWMCECGTVNYGKVCINCGKLSNAETSVSEESIKSTTPYEELNSELDFEMKTKLEELRANGAKTSETKWKNMNAFIFTEYNEGKSVDVFIRCIGTFTYFTEVNGDIDLNTLTNEVLTCLYTVISHRSGYFNAEHLSGEIEKIQKEVLASLANEHGILLDGFLIDSITELPF